MQNIDSYDFNGKKAIVRVDFNVPLDANFNIISTSLTTHVSAPRFPP